MDEHDKNENDFLDAENSGRLRQSILREFIGFVGENKKWWMLPLVFLLLMLGALLILGGTGVAPFIYSLF